MKILSIESSCDETSVAIVEDGRRVWANVIASQIVEHAQTGGVVPEVAARRHVDAMMPVLQRAFEEAGDLAETRGLARIGWDDIDAIAVTREPGLVGCVAIGRAAAEALAFAHGKPLILTNHIHGHMYSGWLYGAELGSGTAASSDAADEIPSEPEFPALILTVSGGHSDIWLMRGHGDFEILGKTVDDAAGEAFDKVSRLLGLGYPGGPVIERRALDGNPAAVDFPRAAMRDYDFSFSGLKTAVLYYLQGEIKARPELLADDGNFANGQFVNDVAASFQEAVVDALVSKLIKAVKEYAPREVHLVGGCSANRHLREKIVARLARGKRPPVFRTPVKMSYCTDNAAMIGGAAYWLKNPPLD
jgi:N6-L-threonylcarbamoyladenine synthase